MVHSDSHAICQLNQVVVIIYLDVDPNSIWLLYNTIVCEFKKASSDILT